MNLAHALTDDYVICYRLKMESGYVKLKLWEPPMPRDSPEHTFLYAVNFNCTRLSEAEAFLRNYLLTNGAIDVPEVNFPEQGEVAILPFPTWGMDKD